MASKEGIQGMWGRASRSKISSLIIPRPAVIEGKQQSIIKSFTLLYLKFTPFVSHPFRITTKMSHKIWNSNAIMKNMQNLNDENVPLHTHTHKKILWKNWKLAKRKFLSKQFSPCCHLSDFPTNKRNIFDIFWRPTNFQFPFFILWNEKLGKKQTVGTLSIRMS